ncbi:uncharacterized protein LOC115416199 [Sphaeramia orbicularis]|uniref:uncharacterized protein LOC115416199 n=1 Tax=Sphaeramia orbicularis TaxID=375764 RepID=UPI00117D4FF3|nr:uncharacterized protein LOC115416199 [Sphaeramia orbicularis]
METAVIEEIPAVVAVATGADTVTSEQASSTKELRKTPRPRPGRQRGRRSQRGKRRGPADKRRGSGEKRRGQKDKRRGLEEQKEGVAVKRIWNEGKRRWDKKHYCVFCRRPQVKIARHLLKKHADQQEVLAASELPPGSKQRHLLLEQLRCRGNYLHNIEVIRQGSGEIIPWRRPSEDVDARNYLPCPLCLGFFLRADLWKHQASCVKKMNTNTCKSNMTSDPAHRAAPQSAAESAGEPAHDHGTARRSDPSEADRTVTSDLGTKDYMTSDLGTKGDMTSDLEAERPRKRFRVQAAASRLLPISSGASESCSEVLHRMNQDLVSHQVKSDWLICKYGNTLIGSQDGSQRRYDYVSQKLRELGRFLLAAKSLDSGIRTLQDLLVPGRLSLALSAARKACGYRWSRPPLAVKTTLKTVCEIAIGESLQDGKWEAAAKTTDFYHSLGRDWDNLELPSPTPDHLDLPSPTPDHDGPVGGAKPKKRSVQSRNQKMNNECQPAACGSRPGGLSQSSTRPVFSIMSPAGLPAPITVPVVPRRIRRRPWSSAEKEAVWRQLGVHVLFQSVPGKEVCQRCLDQEPVLRGRHWKDIKNQVYNQIQSQKKQQFHAQVDSEENQVYNQIQNQKKQQYQAQMDSEENPEPPDQIQTKKKQQYQAQAQMDHQDQYQAKMDHQEKNPIQNLKKPQYQPQLDHHDHIQVHKKQMYPMDHQVPLDRDTSILTGSTYGPEGPHQVPEQSLLDRESVISPFQVPHRTSGTHMDQLLSRTMWTDETLTHNYPMSRTTTLLQDPAGPGPVPPNPHSGHVHF